MSSVMKPFVLSSILALAACAPQLDPGTPGLPECKKLSEHVFRITPESRSQLDGLPEPEQRKRLDQMMSKVPVEDFAQCIAADPKVIACMQAAPDVAALRACVPVKKG